ncbi:predicted protein [Plenodomus lingam JN3]|uniref:Predicted protein n=1 Tax=Leptosphaeria maculans (strain JN3 / isolate v23.1.3 / race Av1-4-5-6-7-8) TaxID=985895 RepID=E5A591_LEPMJ|nr:predicted protein [Plenodomus lingam JN3]CBX98789.1 predicted protein [Plenodomus lingam JN3]
MSSWVYIKLHPDSSISTANSQRLPVPVLQRYTFKFTMRFIFPACLLFLATSVNGHLRCQCTGGTDQDHKMMTGSCCFRVAATDGKVHTGNYKDGICVDLVLWDGTTVDSLKQGWQDCCLSEQKRGVTVEGGQCE